MTKNEFKKKWESNESAGGITFDDIMTCAEQWGLCRFPKISDIFLLRYLVLKAANTEDAEDFPIYNQFIKKRIY